MDLRRPYPTTFQQVNQSNAIKRNSPRIPTQVPGAPQVQQTIYIDQSQPTTVTPAYGSALHAPMQISYGRPISVASATQSAGQAIGAQAPQQTSLVQAAQPQQQPTAYALQGSYIQQGYSFPLQIGIPAKAMAPASAQSMTFYTQPVADNIMVDQIYHPQQIQQQYIPNISKSTATVPPIQSTQIKKIKAEQPTQMHQQYPSGYGNVMIGHSMPQTQSQQQAPSQQPELFLQRGSKFDPNLTSPPGLFNIVPRGDLPGINFVSDY